MSNKISKTALNKDLEAVAINVENASEVVQEFGETVKNKFEKALSDYAKRANEIKLGKSATTEESKPQPKS